MLIGPFTAQARTVIRCIQRCAVVVQQDYSHFLVRTTEPFMVGVAVINEDVTRYIHYHRLSFHHERQTGEGVALFDDDGVVHLSCIQEPQPAGVVEMSADETGVGGRVGFYG